MAQAHQAFLSESGAVSLAPLSSNNSARRESWETICAAAERIEYLMPLSGWGAYTALYRVHLPYLGQCVYAVAGE